MTKGNRRGMKSPFKVAAVVSLALGLGLGAGLTAAQEKLLSERGAVAIESTSQVDMFRIEKDSGVIPRDYVQQPPLIPHTIKGYNITQNFNKCMDCHSWTRYKEAGATKVSLTHFKDRDGKELTNISPRRYFCMQCHVPQYDAKPLVGNTFKPVAGVKR